MSHFLASVLISYSSPSRTVLDAFTASPCSLTRPLSQASAAIARVLNNRMDHRYLSIRSFSFSGIIQLFKKFMEVGDGLNPLVIIGNIILFVWRVQIIAVQTKSHKNDLYSKFFFQ